jgi:hypothetical protein
VFQMQGPGQRGPGARPAVGAGANRGAVRQGVMAGPGVSGTAATAGMSGVAGVAGAAGGQQARPGYTPSGAKIGRNDACWCGSGRKYKKCHGMAAS